MSGDHNEEPVLDSDAVLELNFVPAWARKPPAPSRFEFKDEEHERPRREHRRDTDRDYPGAREKRRGPREMDDRPAARRRPERAGRPPADSGGGDRGPGRTGGTAGRHERREGPEARRLPPVEVSFFPDRRQLAAIVRQIHASRKAYPLLDVASLLMGKPEFCQVKIESPRGAVGTDIYLCESCRMVGLDSGSIVAHAFREHARTFFTIEETEIPEPAGQFSCVARCGLSGELLGPPNHHSYSERVLEMHSSRFSHMPIEEYRRNIQTVRDEDLIARWKSGARKQILYRPSGREAQQAEPMSRFRAEQYFREHFGAGMVSATRRAVIPATVAQKIEDPDLRAAVRAAWQREQRFPRSVLFALRAALKHMSLHVFRAGQGINFVTHAQPSALDPKFAVAEIAEVLLFLGEHPGSSRKDLVLALRPGEEDKPEGARDILSPLGWLIEKGHIIEFFNGTLSVPLDGGRTERPRESAETRAPARAARPEPAS
jgi:hypothetical protein